MKFFRKSAAKKSYKKSRKQNIKRKKAKAYKKMSKLQVIKPTFTGVSHSVARLDYKANMAQKLFKTLSPGSTFDAVVPLGLIAPINTQGVRAFSAMFDGDSVQGMNNIDMRTLNAAINTTSSTLNQAGQRSFKILLDQAISTTIFTNQGPTNCEFEIYDFVSKVTKVQLTDPGNDWVLGIQDEQVGVSNPYTIGLPYCQPTSVKRLNMNWSVVRHTKVSLGYGRSHEHSFMFNPKRVIDTEYAAQFKQIRGITCYSLLILRGGLGDANRSGNIVEASICFSRAKLIAVNRLRYKTRVVTDTARHYEVTNALQHIADEPIYTKEEDGDVINTLDAANYA